MNPAEWQDSPSGLHKVPPYMGNERRRRPSPWKSFGSIAGTVVATLTIAGAVASFLRPSVVATLAVEPKADHDADMQKVNARIDALLTGVDSKLDILIKRRR